MQAGIGDCIMSAVRQRLRACSPEPLSGTQLDCQHRLALVLQDSAQSSHPPSGKKELTPEQRNQMEQNRLNAVAKMHAALAKKSQMVACEA